MTRNAPITAAKASEGAYGLRPQDLQSAYFPGEAPDAPASEPQTIALVDAYNDPNAESDLRIYDEEFHLPACTTANGCLEQVNQNGETGNPPFPNSALAKQEKEALCEKGTDPKAPACMEVEEADGWTLEISVDIEVAHAVCENCRILLVEADNGELSSLEAAEETAVKLDAGEISDSWGGEEPPSDSEAFNHPGTVITVATGDTGYLNWSTSKEEAERYELQIGAVNYPASSPHVIAVGGTTLMLSDPSKSWRAETAWGRGGGGCSTKLQAAPWQLEVADWQAVGCGQDRAVADISADANPSSGFATYDSVPYVHLGSGLKNASILNWTPIGGTSVASPIIASMFALAGGSHGVQYPAQTVYSHLLSASLHDVSEGANGKCAGNYLSGCSGSMNPLSLTDCGQGVWICNATTGYDGPTGVGTPNGIAALKPVRQHTGGVGAPEEPLTEECAEPIGPDGRQRVCGTLNPHTSEAVGYYFLYNKGQSCTAGKETPLQQPVQGESIPVSSDELFGLEPNTQYAYCLLAMNASGETLGSPVTFTTEAAVPRVPETRFATAVTSDSATLQGKLYGEPIKTNWYFTYAPGSSCTAAEAKTTTEEEESSGKASEEVHAAIGTLQPNTTYTACLIATNSHGSSTGAGVALTTLLPKPQVLSESSSQPGRRSAVLSGEIKPQNGSVKYLFQYGLSTTYTSETPVLEVGEAKARQAAELSTGSVLLSGLTPGQTYHYRLMATNSTGQEVGADQTFSTLAPQPASVTSGYGQATSPSTANINGTVDPDGVRTIYQVQYGTSGAYGSTSAAIDAGEGLTAQPVQVGLTGLLPATTYYYRLLASSEEGPVTGAQESFTTPNYTLLSSLGPLTLSLGNTPPTTKTKRKALTRPQRLRRALRACAKHHGKRKRRACRRRARKRYSPKVKKKRAKK
jgi:hypothetical protein